MPTKTKTTSKAKDYAEQVREAEEAVRAKYHDQREQLMEAKLNIDRFEDLKDECEIALSEIEARLRRGDATVSAEDLGKAEAGVRRATLLNESPGNNVKRLERSMPNVNAELAEAVAHVLEPIYKGVVIIPTFVDVPVPADADLPVLVVRQEKSPETHWQSGRLSGRVTMTLHRTLVQRELNARAISEAARKAGNIFELNLAAGAQSVEKDCVFVDTQRAKVNLAYSPTPWISAEPTEESAQQIAGLLTHEIASAVRGDESIRRELMDQQLGFRRGYAERVSAGLVSSKVEDGIRMTVVECKHKVRFGSGSRTNAQTLPDFIKGLAGEFEKGVGVISGARCLDVSTTEQEYAPAPGYKAMATLYVVTSEVTVVSKAV